METAKTKFNRSLIAVILSLIIALCCSACGGDDPEPEVPTVPGTASEATTDGGGQESSDPQTTSGGGSETGKTTKQQGGKKTTDSGSVNPTSQTTSVSPTSPTSSGKTTASQTTTTTKPKSDKYYPPRVLTNSAPGDKTYEFDDGSMLDYSNTKNGYVMVKYGGSRSNVRVQVVTPKSSKPTYIIKGKSWVAIPLGDGNGKYSIQLLSNDGGNSYYVDGKTEISVSLSSSTAPFLRPNVFCNYSTGSGCVKKAAELTRGCEKDVEKVEAIYNYVVKNFSYDKAKASKVANAAYVPDLGSVWSSKKGICFDYASTMAAMLRTQGIPTKVVVGNASYSGKSSYHAWISVYIKNSGWVNGIIEFDGNKWKLMDPTFASTGGNNYDWDGKASHSAQYYY